MRLAAVSTVLFIMAGPLHAQTNPRYERSYIQRAISEGRARATVLARWAKPAFEPRNGCSVQEIRDMGDQYVREYESMERRLAATSDSVLLRQTTLTASPAVQFKTSLARMSRELTDAESRAIRTHDAAQCKFVIDLSGQASSSRPTTGTRLADTARASRAPSTSARNPTPASSKPSPGSASQAPPDSATVARYSDAVASVTDRMTAHEDKLSLRGTTWHTTFGIGATAEGFPLFTNDPASRYSTVDHAGGVGAVLELSVWPIYSRHYGLGFVTNGASTAITGSDSSYSERGGSFAYGLKGYAGYGILAFVVEATTHQRHGSSRSTYTSGEAAYSASRLAFGPRIGSAQSGALDVLLFRERPSFTPTKSSAGSADSLGLTVRLTAQWFGVQLDYLSDYPAAGTPTYALIRGTNPFGTYLAARIFVQYRSFGKPYWR
jgi:hypothetical protein